MKQVIILAALLLAAFIAIGQNGKVITAGGSSSQEVDTFQLTGNTLELSLSDDNQPLQTVDLSGVAENIYNTDGTLPENRVVDTDDYELEVTTGPTASGTRRGLVLRSGYQEELATHIPLTIVAGIGATDSIWFSTFDTNVLLNSSTGKGIRYASDYTFDNDQMIVSKKYVDDAISGAPSETEGYAVAETNSSDLQNIGTTWEALEAQTSAGVSSDWSFSTGTDLFTYSGSTAKYLISFSACLQFSTATFQDIRFTVQENGTDTDAKALTSVSDTGQTMCVSGFDVVTADNTDTFGLGMVLPSGSATNVTIESSQLAITKLVGQ